MNTKHTPGPWTLKEGFLFSAERHILLDLLDTDEENARLIAASPELFTALTELLDFAESPEADYSAPHEYEAVREDAIKRARAALAKAGAQ